VALPGGRERALSPREEMVFRREVPVDGPERDAGLAGDVAHLHRVVTAFGGKLHGGVDDALPPRRLIGRERAQVQLDGHRLHYRRRQLPRCSGGPPRGRLRAGGGTPARSAAISVSGASSSSAVRRYTSMG